jgi:hypothetical protein
MFKRLIATALALLASLPAAAGEIELEKLGVSISACDDWFTLAREHLDKINQAASKAAVLHASLLGMKLVHDDTESCIALLQSKFLLGVKEDNPNLILASEKPWSDKFERSGKGYLDLMADRVKRLNAKTRFSSQPKELKIGDAIFVIADAENTVSPDVKTKQRYICGFLNDRYVYFVLSYNSEEDDDFRVMMKSVKSLRPGNQPK